MKAPLGKVLMVRIPAIDSNVSFTYDILLKELKVRFPVKLECIVALNQDHEPSLSDKLAIVEHELVDKQFYDELRDRQVTIVKAEIILKMISSYMATLMIQMY